MSRYTEISYDDFGRMQIRTRKQSGERMLPTPEWAMNDEQLREVIVAFLEQRYFNHRRTGNLLQRLALTEVRMRHDLPGMKAALDSMCRVYMTVEDPARKKKLQSEIEGKDTTIRIAERLAALVTSCVYLYHRNKMDSVDVGEQLGIKPPHVRQLLYRMNQVAERMKNGWKPRSGRGLVGFDTILAMHLHQKGMRWCEIAKLLGQHRCAMQGKVTRAEKFIRSLTEPKQDEAA